MSVIFGRLDDRGGLPIAVASLRLWLRAPMWVPSCYAIVLIFLEFSAARFPVLR